MRMHALEASVECLHMLHALHLMITQNVCHPEDCAATGFKSTSQMLHPNLLKDVTNFGLVSSK